jgi:hypothetical protein
LIFSYIQSCGECEQDLENEVKEVAGSYGRAIFSLGHLDEEEVRNVFSIICYIVDNNIQIHSLMASFLSVLARLKLLLPYPCTSMGLTTET